MESGIKNNEAVYYLQLDGHSIKMNDLLGKKLRFVFQKRINCIVCGKETRKSFGQGFCYNCFTTSPEADECVLRPDLCRAHLDIARDLRWAEGHCLQPHIVYLALSGGLKVGVTRKSQVPVRWIDQGATKAIKVCETPNRHVAGVIESFLMKHFSDKTNWRKMVANVSLPDIDMLFQKEKAVELLPAELKRYVLSDDNQVFNINYPVQEWPEKPVQCNFDKDVVVEGVLKGIRGQYLFFQSYKILNIRKFSGYLVDFFIED